MFQPFSLTFSQPQTPACVQCGGTEYVLESGFYFCAECQLQSQDFREEVYEEYTLGKFKGATTTVPSVKSQEAQSEPIELREKELSSWEALNIILRGLVDELILLGAPKELKVVVLQLWACYLKKIEVAFTSKVLVKKPRLELNFRARDAELIYKTGRAVIRNQKQPVFQRKRKTSKSQSQSESSFSTRRSGIRQLNLKKKHLASAEYSRYIAAASTSQSSLQSELTLETLPSRSPERSEKSYRLHYSRNAKNKLLDLLDTATIIEGEDRDYLQKRYLGRNAKSVEHLTIKKLIAILRIALLSLDSDIHLGDLLRWSQEGYLSLLNAEKLMPPNVSLAKDLKLIFITTLNSRETINKTVNKVNDLLGIHGLKSRILPLIERYLKELCLPSEMYTFIRNLIGLKPPELKLNLTINYEARALAYIIFLLKYLFCLDGVTEKNISMAAHLGNKEIEGGRKLFDWQAWKKYINCRNSVNSFHHQGTRDQCHPLSRFGGATAFLSQWEKIPAKQTLSRRHIINRNMSEVLRRFMREFSQEPCEPLPPSLLPQSSMLQAILYTNALPPRTREILQHDFTQDTLQYLFDANWQKELSAKYDLPLINKPSAEFVIVKPLTGVANWSKINPALRRRSQVQVTIEDDQDKIDNQIKKDMHRTKNKRKGENALNKNRKSHEVNPLLLKSLQNKRYILGQIESLLKGEAVNQESKQEGSWSGVGRGYWVYHSGVTNKDVQARTFDELAETIFQPDFVWLLRVASQVGRVSPREIYRELTKVETMFLTVLKPNGKNVRIYGW